MNDHGESRTLVAFIGDVVGSRTIEEERRYELQQQLSDLMNFFNKRYKRSIVARFVVTLGDEFQGLLRDAHVLPDLIWDLETRLVDVEVRVGVGYGSLTTPLQPEAVGMDGPAFHLARQAINAARSNRHLGGVFAGFGAVEDQALNGFARILRFQRAGWIPTQREVANRLREGRTQRDLASELSITQQGVSSRVRSSGWEAYSEAENGWRAVLGQFRTSTDEVVR